MTAAAEAADAKLAAVENDPQGRIALAEHAASRHGADNDDVAPYARGEVDFLKWEVRRGSLNSATASPAGSPWWRAANGQLLRDTAEAHLLLDENPEAASGSNRAVDRWLAFSHDPSPKSWYHAHNHSIILGYLNFAELAPAELNAEQDFMGVVLLRVLAAEAAVSDAPINLGALPGPVVAALADPRSRGVGMVTDMADFYPQHYPLTLDDIDRLAHRSDDLASLATSVVDDMVRAGSVALVEWAADAHDVPELRQLVSSGELVYPQGLARFHSGHGDGAGGGGGLLAAAPPPQPRTSPFTLDELAALREVVDPEADAVVQHWFEANDEAHPSTMLAAAVTAHDHPHLNSARHVVSDFIGYREPLPPWVDNASLKRASDFFSMWGVPSLLMLGCSSLPDAYAAKKGVQVLHLTARLETDTKRRLMETAQMVIDVAEHGLGVGSQGRTTVRKVRLMHAGIRYLINHDPRIEHTSNPTVGEHHWDPDWGQPINQEDLLGTLTSFTWNVIEGLRTSGVPVSDQEADDWVHLWNVVGWLIGIPVEHLPADYATTCAIAVPIRQRNQAPSPEGQKMTADLMVTMREMVPGKLLNDFPESLAAHVLPPGVAEMVDIGKPGWTRVFFGPFKSFVRKISPALHDKVLNKVVTKLGHHFLDFAEAFERGPARPSFAIPDRLADGWEREPSAPSGGFAPGGARGPWVAKMGWDHVVAGHWKVNPDDLQHLLPKGLELDVRDGGAWVSVLVLDMDGVHFRGLPALPGSKDFAEVNIRCYVTHKGRRGVYFLSIDAHPGAIVWLSRRIFRQPYHRADITYEAAPTGGRLEMTRMENGARLAFDFTTADGQGAPARDGSIEQFLSERYWMFRADRFGRIRSTAIDHDPWDIKPAQLTITDFDLAKLAGVPISGPPDVADWAGSRAAKVHLPQS